MGRNGWCYVGLLAFGWVVLAPSAMAQASVSNNLFTDLRQDPLNEYYQWGNLTWAGGKGGILWAPDAATQDMPAPALDPFWNQKAGAGWTTYTQTGVADGIPTDVFESEPFPARHFLNVSRVIKVDLYVKVANGNDCPKLQFELWKGTEFVGGQLAVRHYLPGPSAPPGYCLVPARLHPEVDRIEKGDVLRLKVMYKEGAGPPQYGTAEGHQSVIRIPFFPPDELYFRIPEIAEEVHQAAAGDVEDWDTAGVWLLAPFALLARRPRLLLVLLLLSASLLAGCAGTSRGGDATPTGLDAGGSAEVRILSGNELNVTGGGVILGKVIDEDLRPVPEAHVSVLGSSFFTATDRGGRFRFDGVPPAAHQIRIDKVGFKSFETALDVVDGKVTRVDITLAPIVDRLGGLKRHEHDEWGDKTSYTLMDDDVHFRFSNTGEVGTCEAFSPQLLVPGKSVCRVDFALPLRPDGSHARILPGTYDVEITLTWPRTENPVHAMGVGIKHNGDRNVTAFYPRVQGVPTHVRSAWEMGDPGHTQFTTWNFFFYVPTNSGRGSSSSLPGPAANEATSTAVSAQLLRSPVHVKVVIHKGIVPLEPAHPDLWAGKDELVLINAEPIANDKYCAKTQGVVPARCTFPNWWATWAPKPLVPAGTAWLEVKLEQSGSGSPEYDWGLLYRPGNLPGPPTDFTQYKAMPTPTTSSNGKQYRLEIKPEETDPVYAKTTNWRFALDDDTGDPALIVDPITFKVTVIAHRSPGYDPAAM